MADRPRLEATTRTITGKAVARLRRQGQLPAVVHGHGVPGEPVTVNTHQFQLLHRRVGPSTLVDLTVDGGQPRPVLVQSVQTNVVTRQLQHVDLFAVRMAEELAADIPLISDGHAPVTERGGTLAYTLTTLRVRALPGDLPEAIHYDLSVLTTLDAVLTVGDLAIPAGLSVQADPSEVVVHVLAPRVEEATGEASAPAGETPEAEAQGDATAAGG